METFDRTTGEILVLTRFVVDNITDKTIETGWGHYDLLHVTTPIKLLTFISEPIEGPIGRDEASDLLVEAFDAEFCDQFNEEAAMFAWRLPSGEIITQHST